VIDQLNIELTKLGLPYKSVEHMFSFKDEFSSYSIVKLDNGKYLTIDMLYSVKRMNEPVELQEIAVVHINMILSSLKKRIRAVDYLQWDGGSLIKRYFFKLTNGKHLIVTTENGYLRSILIQVDKWRKYSYGINGQAGTNTTELFMDFYCESRIPFNFI
jgi:hypothetical protein